MFKKKLCVILVVLIAAPLFLPGEQEYKPFPIKPGTDVWKTFTSHSQKVEALQLPQNELERMSTAQLLRVCMNYPMAPEIMAYDTPQKGIEVIIGQFNGLQELMKRKGAAVVMLKFYSKLNPGHLDDGWTLRKKGEFAFKIRYIELLLAQDLMLSQLNSTQRRQLLKAAIQKLESKNQNLAVYGLMSLNTPTLIIGRLLEKDNRQRFRRQVGESDKLKLFLKSARLIDSGLIDQIVAEAKEYLN